MQWTDLLGHHQQRQWFSQALASNRLATSFLFVGPDGIGKRTFAKLLAKSMLCRSTRPQQLAPCGICEDCTQVDASTHPDLLQVGKPADKAVLPIELLIGEREKRMREGLCHDINMRPYGGRRKIAILDDADSLNVEGANCLLKTLEEPPLGSMLILIGTSLQRQLPTIRSRCQAIIFKSLEPQQLQTLLLRNGLLEDAEAALHLAKQAGGSLSEASLLANEDLQEFRMTLLESLTASHMPMMELAKKCSGLADGAGKDARVKRDRLKMVFRMAAALYRDVSLHLSAATVSSDQAHQSQLANEQGDSRLAEAARRLLENWTAGEKAAVDCWKRCLLAIEQVDRNANQTALLECWSSDLAKLSGR